MQLRKTIRQLLSDLERIGEAALSRRLRRRTDVAERSGHVLISGPGNGSIGDEAMYEAFVRACEGPVTVVAREPGDLLWTDSSDRVKYVYLRHLLYGWSWQRRRDLRQLIGLVSRAESLSIVGADIMDGVYADFASARRFRTAALAADAGANARILGFSWNSNPARRAMSAMRAVGDRVLLLARDEESGKRLDSDGGQRVDTVADLAFLTGTDAPLANEELARWLATERAAGRRVIVVNANPRQESRFPGLQKQYVALIEELRRTGFSCVLLPHDSRGGERSEEAYIARLAAEVGTDHVFHVRKAPLPEQVVAVAREGELVVSGRMHLVVLASVAGRSTVSLEYQDKFAGLYRLLGYDGRVTIDNNGGWDLAAAVQRGIEVASDAEKALSESWPKIQERSARNIAALSSAS